ncbi:META domain-containing protein [Lewinella sp. IMCC34183]|uniref:META domain-containing protein n=1 Tax=Lewinella sp. IMCC34183 TaxID=2248762 RepID=UPI000E2749E7|nr:META domain-containing protein [Lewinella sp. IMCC34183]
MRHLLYCLITVIIIGTGCGITQPAADEPPVIAPSPPQATADNSRTSLDWSGLYYGTVPGMDGNGREISLKLRKDETYVLNTRSMRNATDEDTITGRFRWEPDGGSIKLLDIDSINRPIYYRVGENYLRQLDLVNRPIEGAMSELYYLRKDRDRLFDRRWWLDSLGTGPVVEGKSGPYIELSANGQRVTGNAGCNSLRGSYVLSGDSLTFPPLSTTKMACPAISVERAFLDVLRRTVGYAVSGSTLRLVDSRGEYLATLRAEDPAD